MSQSHTLTALLLCCSIAALNAQKKIELVKVKPSALQFCETLACDVYARLASPGEENKVRTGIKTRVLPHIMSQDEQSIQALMAFSGEENVGFITYEVIEDKKTITLHLSPIKEEYAMDAYNKAFEIIGGKYGNEFDMCAACPEFLPGLAKLLEGLGFKPAEEYKCSDDYPKPLGRFQAYTLKLRAKDSNQ